MRTESKPKAGAAAKDSIKVQTELEGELKSAFEDLERTGMPRSELLRQGLVRLACEFKKSGALTILTLESASV